jgi:DNA-binding NarL/FixJ family response regulator
VKILVVDDHILFREGLVSLLSNKEGLSVVGEAGSVREAIEKTSQLCPDLVLMDISLPDGSGLDAMRSILSNNPKILFVILTPQESDKLLFESIRHGAVGFILKNTPASKLILSLRAIIRGEAALSRKMTRKVLGEFQRLGNLYKPDNNTDLSILSERELQVLELLAGRATNQEIADSLFIAVNTVKVHVHNILSKLELTNRREAGEFARNHNINPPT